MFKELEYKIIDGTHLQITKQSHRGVDFSDQAHGWQRDTQVFVYDGFFLGSIDLPEAVASMFPRYVGCFNGCFVWGVKDWDNNKQMVIPSSEWLQKFERTVAEYRRVFSRETSATSPMPAPEPDCECKIPVKSVPVIMVRGKYLEVMSVERIENDRLVSVPVYSSKPPFEVDELVAVVPFSYFSTLADSNKAYWVAREGEYCSCGRLKDTKMYVHQTGKIVPACMFCDVINLDVE